MFGIEEEHEKTRLKKHPQTQERSKIYAKHKSLPRDTRVYDLREHVRKVNENNAREQNEYKSKGYDPPWSIRQQQEYQESKKIDDLPISRRWKNDSFQRQTVSFATGLRVTILFTWDRPTYVVIVT